jgi:hypothetical protein
MTPQQLIEAFWKDKAAVAVESNVRLASLHSRYFAEPLLRHGTDFLACQRTDGVIEEVKETSYGAVAIVQEPLETETTRKRYHLLAHDDSWKITSIEWECIQCSGSGKSGRMSCQTCGGTGWHDHRKNAD